MTFSSNLNHSLTPRRFQGVTFFDISKTFPPFKAFGNIKIQARRYQISKLDINIKIGHWLTVGLQQNTRIRSRYL